MLEVWPLRSNVKRVSWAIELPTIRASTWQEFPRDKPIGLGGHVNLSVNYCFRLSAYRYNTNNFTLLAISPFTVILT
jgi:hypothetical protein